MACTPLSETLRSATRAPPEFRLWRTKSSESTRREGTMIRHSLMWCGLAAALTVSGPARGQDYPNRQITILVGIAAGGITDVTTRQYAAGLSKNMDQKIIIEKRPRPPPAAPPPPLQP